MLCLPTFTIITGDLPDHKHAHTHTHTHARPMKTPSAVVMERLTQPSGIHGAEGPFGQLHFKEQRALGPGNAVSDGGRRRW